MRLAEDGSPPQMFEPMAACSLDTTPTTGFWDSRFFWADEFVRTIYLSA
jgi:hypothetical protein